MNSLYRNNRLVKTQSFVFAATRAFAVRSMSGNCDGVNLTSVGFYVSYCNIHELVKTETYLHTRRTLRKKSHAFKEVKNFELFDWIKIFLYHNDFL